MNDWNVIVTVYGHGFTQACRLLEQFGPVHKTEFYNVLVMKTDNAREFMDRISDEVSEHPEILSFLSRVMPLTHCFNFQTPADFESMASQLLLDWVPQLSGKKFHVRIHRRGYRGRLSTPEEERFLNQALLDRLQEAGNPGQISFEDSDAIIALETCGQRAGLSLWTREDLKKYPLLHLD